MFWVGFVAGVSVCVVAGGLAIVWLIARSYGH